VEIEPNWICRCGAPDRAPDWMLPGAVIVDGDVVGLSTNPVF
jgi:hypothetical protein